MDYSDKINNHDLSEIWTTEKYLGVWLEEDATPRNRSKVYGFIGDDYQRFYIHFISAVKVPEEQNKYLVYGKTRVRNTISPFLGSIVITDARTIIGDTIWGYYEGFTTCSVVLYEDSKQTSTGVIQGEMTTKFMLNSEGYFGYSGMHNISDGFNNNQFIGTWTRYKTGKTKKCHWGDGRIPNCGDLDVGAGEFSINKKYEMNGWESYTKSWLGDPNLQETKNAEKEEAREWWKD